MQLPLNALPPSLAPREVILSGGTILLNRHIKDGDEAIAPPNPHIIWGRGLLKSHKRIKLQPITMHFIPPTPDGEHL